MRTLIPELAFVCMPREEQRDHQSRDVKPFRRPNSATAISVGDTELR